MYLRALEIQGFKSFPDKTVLSFGSEMTGIVGPNGSGKSNIADAIRWVMGEQSTKALRGGKMEDVIFGGTIKRPQVGFAEVSLILDNSSAALPMDESEVMVTRRYYRSGESEYYINRQSVRLKDVNELFMDTGLGREGYSLISQGRIDEILSVKSGDRRQVFEEAAGISRFRHRKEEAERKLQSTDENLLRIGDKIAELELQVEPLKKQAETAKKYLVLRDELRTLEVSLWLSSLDRLAEQAKKAEDDLRSALEAKESCRAQQDGLFAGVEQMSEKMRQRESESEALRAEIAAREADAAKIESDAAVLKNQLENNRQNIERMRVELSAQDERAQSMDGQIEAQRDIIARLELKRGEAETELDSLLQTLSGASDKAGQMDGRIAAISEGRSESQRKAAALEAQLAALFVSAQELMDRQTDALGQRQDIERRLIDARQSDESCQKKLLSATEKASELKNAIAGRRLLHESKANKEAALSKKAMELTMARSAAESRLGMLREMERDYEGFSRAVKGVMQEAARGGLKNICGPVSQLIRVEDGFAVAIETALGAATQNIVVEREEDGKAAIGYLKRRELGRATFLPISAIRGRELGERGIENEPGFMGVGSSIVSCDSKYSQIIASLLGRTVICEDMDRAIAMARKYSYRFRIVTADGQVINAGGSMTGGAVSKSAGIITRKNEIERLVSQTAELEKKQKDAAVELETARRELTASEYEINAASEELRGQEDAVLRLEGEKEHNRILLESLERADGELLSELEQLEQRLRRNKADTDAADGGLKELSAKEESLRLEYEQSLEGRSRLAEEHQRINDSLSEIRQELARLAAETAAAQGAVRQLQELKGVLSGDGTAQREAIARLEQGEDELTRRMSQAGGRLAGINAETDRLRGELKALLDGKMELEAERTRLSRQAQDKNDELLRLEREYSRLEQKQAAGQMEEKQLVDKLWDTYELTHSTAQEVRKELDSLQDARRRVAELKKGISALGTPNIGAIDEYARVSERYEFLTGQRDDVRTAKGELEGVIRDITGEMEQIFAERFKLISDCFTATFTELFGGGRAALELEDEDDILGCGIEIRVQPPGKQLKTITLLSGGEKAFVAIAIYFAILKVRPTPFCVMDEIDAALDDSNVARFAAYLRTLSGSTQFIVITHRRGTMEEADVLYGVTMQEQGVSKMLTIDLNRLSGELGI